MENNKNSVSRKIVQLFATLGTISTMFFSSGCAGMRFSGYAYGCAVGHPVYYVGHPRYYRQRHVHYVDRPHHKCPPGGRPVKKQKTR